MRLVGRWGAGEQRQLEGEPKHAEQLHDRVVLGARVCGPLCKDQRLKLCGDSTQKAT